MLPILIPIGVAIAVGVTKTAVSDKVEQAIKNASIEAIKQGSGIATNEAINRITGFFIKQSISMIINVSLILIAIFTSIFIPKEISIFLIASIYSSTILYGLYTLSRLKYQDIYTVIFIYKLDVKKYISERVYNETYEQAKIKVYRKAKAEAEWEIDNLGFFNSIANYFFGEEPECIAKRIANNSAPDIAKETVKNVLLQTKMWFIWFVISFIVYVFIFRFFVAPILVEDATNLTSIEAFLYPFLFSVDYFVDTNLLIYLKP